MQVVGFPMRRLIYIVVFKCQQSWSKINYSIQEFIIILNGIFSSHIYQYFPCFEEKLAKESIAGPNKTAQTLIRSIQDIHCLPLFPYDYVIIIFDVHSFRASRLWPIECLKIGSHQKSGTIHDGFFSFPTQEVFIDTQIIHMLNIPPRT